MMCGNSKFSCIFSFFIPETIVYVFSFTRLPSPDHQAVLTDKAILCATSCLRILKAVSNSYCNFPLLLECLFNIETCVSWIEKKAMLEQEKRKPAWKKIEEMVVESFQIVNKWCKKYLNSRIPCYDIAEAERELQVCMLYVNLISYCETS